MRIDVADDGIGISEQEQQRLFTSFFRARNAINSQAPGTGLGLLQAKRFANLLGGDITFVSAEGKGSTFSLTLQRAEASAKAFPEAEQQRLSSDEESEALSQDTILVVDDNDELRRFLYEIFSPEYRVVLRSDAASALKYLETEYPSIILSDVMMIGMQGDEMCRLIKENPVTAGIPVLLLTAKAGNQAMIEGLEMGADDYIAKPFDVAVLKAKVHAHVANRHRLHEYYGKIALQRGEERHEVQPDSNVLPNEADCDFVKRARQIVETHLSDTEFDIEHLCREMALCRTLFYERLKTDDFLIFELMNEIQDGGWGSGANLTDGGKQYEVLNEWNQAAVDAVRATGGKNATRYLAVAGYSANPELTMAHLKLPEDSATGRLLVSVHSYDPAEFALNAQYTEWGHTADPSKKAPWGDEDFIREMCSKLYEKYVSKNIPVYFGEFGCIHRAQARAESFRKYYLEYFCRAARIYGIAAFYWDNGNAGTGKECFGLVNHSSGAFLNNGEEIVNTMVKGYCTEDENYTLEAVYDNAPE